MSNPFRCISDGWYFISYTSSDSVFELQAKSRNGKLIDEFEKWLVDTFPSKEEKCLDFSCCDIYVYEHLGNKVAVGAFGNRDLWNTISRKFKDLEEKHK